MPLFLHEREAHGDFVEILKKHPEVIEQSCVHCFTGTLEEAKNYIEMGCYIGITGFICDDRKAGEIRKAIREGVIPLNRIMIETDAPFQTPRTLPNRWKRQCGGRNEPCLLPLVLKTVAECYNLPELEVSKQIKENTYKFFKIQ